MGDGLFGDLPAIEVPLERAPLSRVLTQVRYPSVPELALPEGQHRFAQALRNLYPIGRQQSGINLVIGAQGVMQQPSQGMVWQLQSRNREWQVSFSESFVSLETSKYISREDFCERLTTVLEALTNIADPVLCDRVGIRYINQISDQKVLGDLSQFMHPHVLGGWALAQKTEQAQLVQSVNESLFVHGADKLLVRSGWIPAGVTAEPTVPVSSVNTWLLDLDSFTDVAEDFSVERVSSRVLDLAAAAYHGFRGLVKDAFLEHYA